MLYCLCKLLLHFVIFDTQELEKLEAEEASKEQAQFVPATNYKDKYEKLIGKVAAKDAAKITTANKQYGFGKFSNSAKYLLLFLASDVCTVKPHYNASHGPINS